MPSCSTAWTFARPVRLWDRAISKHGFSSSSVPPTYSVQTVPVCVRMARWAQESTPSPYRTKEATVPVPTTAVLLTGMIVPAHQSESA